ncbi:MAG: hypothetical protein KDJ22_13785, partial [Candidatus Competibacteraceae bacterium]|nr:hypothetical protein [Candidatus Competibacteraceae bacterium]MCP5124444.1 hypothetical protein [Gammaproteobacteria bacterium]MCP5307178.1 hypothetical protein [Chromatiaceae bacterium]
MSDLLLLGIRHHGPGSARSVLKALTEWQPDLILVEGPPDAQDLLPLAADPSMKPPVALLIYDPAEPRRAVYYPFAEFSPEWQAIQYGLRRQTPVRFMDLPQAIRMVLDIEAETVAEPTGPMDEATTETEDIESQHTEDEAQDEDGDGNEDSILPDIRRDPLRWVAETAGYGDSERWWEHLVEQRQDSSELFQAIQELMSALRAEADTQSPSSELEQQREAAMRSHLRAARKEGFARIAVVCGAWHVPALAELPPAREDTTRLKGLPKRKLAATWVPWTYGRLTYASGYGAGIEAPGFYQHLWENAGEPTIHWLAQVAQLLRERDLAASTASVIEAARLADALAALRERPRPTQEELNEATLSVLCHGDVTPLRLIEEQLLIGERLGEVPDSTPMLPLQQDLQRLQKRLRLPPEAGQRVLELDLRKPNDLERSQLLHRLNLLNIPWGQIERASGKGTFKENWRLQWQPELAVAVIEANLWGSTILAAATARACDRARNTDQLSPLTELVEQTLLAELPEAIGEVMDRLQNVAALTSDIPHLMDSLPPLARILRYGNVRQTDAGLVGHVVDGLVTRIAIGLPAACSALDDEAAEEMFGRVRAMQDAISVLQDPEQTEIWRAALAKLVDQANLHGLLAGYACRVLFEQDVLSTPETARRMGLTLSLAGEPARAAAWLEGFLHGSGQLLLHHAALWDILDGWVSNLSGEAFVPLLPLLRRTFARFPAPERRQMGERVKRGSSRHAPTPTEMDVDVARADRVLPILAQVLGLA